MLSLTSCIESGSPLVWNPACQITDLDDERICIYSEQEKIAIKGNGYLLLAPLLSEGKFNASALVERLKDRLSAEMVFYALTRLEQKGLIQAKSNLLSDEVAAYCQLLKITEQEALNRLASTKVYLSSIEGEIDPELISLLLSLNIKVVEQVKQADFSVVITSHYLHQEIEKFDRTAWKLKHPWMLLKPWGSEIWIGPSFDPARAGCYACLCSRLKQNKLDQFFPPSTAGLRSTLNFAWNFAATEIFKRIVRGECEHLEGKILSFNTIDMQTHEHILIHQPLCRCCPEKNVLKPSHFSLERRKKRGGGEGGYRTLSAEETWRKFSSQMSPILGVVNSIEPPEEDFESTIHVYLSDANVALPEASKQKEKNTFRCATGGKGTTQIAAKVSGLCEALERVSGVFQGDETYIESSFCKLRENAIHPGRVLLFSQKQYQEREKTNPHSHRFSQVAKPFSEDDEIAWSPIWSLTENRVKFYPTTCCYFSYPTPQGKWGVYGDSNGCAAGNCLEEAILQGFLELVERDSVAIWWYNRIHRPTVDLESFDHPYIQTLLKTYERLGREIWVLDLTSDLAIPSFAALSRLKGGENEKILMGFGTHLDVEIGLLRALTEMNQFLVWETILQVQNSTSAKVEQDWLQNATIENQPYLKKGGETKRVSDFPKWESDDLLEDILHCQKIVENRGMELLVLDQTRKEIGLNVVRVIVPGLRHFWPRFAPGRLYDIPVEMGWLKTPLNEKELNPIGMFL